MQSHNSNNHCALGMQERLSVVSATVDKAQEVLGLLSQYVVVGLMLGALPNMTYPVFTGYFHMTCTTRPRRSSSSTGKAFIGMISDCVPIYGYRRKSWMMLGWCGAFICLLAAQNATINLDAPVQGGVVSLLFGVATILYVFAEVPADALSLVYTTRTVSSPPFA
ncbi:hypothetical protein SPRG_14854 [Saprolegnia parasitica CBS 223.65]|uniref:Uncharacterized protein n=1 Tax=Saprolegnia parasitica (strain CBS 223.65) TaxID=695850 RepID=A0A067BWM2_SAPPC|nr:hypothetical protein SPRG_14854 [Saprolegnia parasitica CBS 223.65]KDO19017.1 hypothetical protein SPRG_14854 [Saprolegnia parasitica CBS 223.65]|eukprot:XP_012210272.1 hypothetical protein SPRG_14854 [Saprolegnia parasitica CBS 223.65]